MIKTVCGKGNLGSKIEVCKQGAKKVIFTAWHSGKLKLAFTSPNIISTSPKSVLMRRLISQFFCNLNSSKNFTCPSGKSRTAFTSPIAKSTSPGLPDTTFFARCVYNHLPTSTETLMNFQAFAFYLKLICTFFLRFSIFLGQKKGKLNSRGA